jgi:transcriptional regulator with XRE-family HTH domain
MINTQVGKQLAAERVAARKTRDELAEESGVSRSTIWRIERSQRDASVEQLTRLCGVLGLSVSKFFERVEERTLYEGNKMTRAQQDVEQAQRLRGDNEPPKVEDMPLKVRKSG